MYVDGFLVPLEDANVETYRQTAELFAKKAKALGAYGSVETIGITAPSSSDRDQARQAAMADGSW